MKDDQELFHYTTPKGALGIAQNKDLWATNIRYLNDATEYLYALELIRLARLRRATELSKQEHDYLTYVLGDQTSGFFNIWRQGTQYYVVSLSSQQDSLSQWRAYAPRSGYAIGWKRGFLQRLATEKGFSLEPCVYDVKEQERLVNAVLDDVLQSYRQNPIALDFSELPLRGAPTEVQVREVSKLAVATSHFDAALGKVATVCKNPAFSEEREWRLVSPAIGWGSDKIRCREGRTMLVPYVELQLPRAPVDGDARPHVVCGPSPDLELSQFAALTLFGTWGGCSVSPSLVPYREW